jgi:hypothetical protein
MARMPTIKASAADRLEDARRQMAAAHDRSRTLVLDEVKAVRDPETYLAWQRDTDETHARISGLEKVIEAIETEVLDAELQQLRVKADARLRLNEALARRLVEEGRPLIEKLLSLLGELAEADIETARINSRLPDSERIKRADVLARARDPRPEHHVKERPIDVWCFAATGVEIRDQTSVIDRGNGQGWIPSASSAGEIRCVKRKALSVDYYKEEDRQPVDPIYTALRLPHLDRGGFAWSGTVANPVQALELLSRQGSDERQLLNKTVFVEEAYEPPPELKAGRTRPGDDRSVLR